MHRRAIADLIFTAGAIAATVILSIRVNELTFAYEIFPLLSLLWILLAIASFALGIVLIQQRVRLLGFAIAVLPTLAAIVAWTGESYIDGLKDQAHFTAMRPYYDRQVARLPRNRSRFEEFNWAGMAFAHAGIVVDESDQIALPPGHQSPAWIARARRTDLMCGGKSFDQPVRPFGGHYYLVNIGC